MLRTIRVRLVLSYAGIALLVTLSLGAVLLARLRAYYASMEEEYLNSNAKAISALAAPLLIQKSPKDVQNAQVSNLSFISQTRVRILDPQRNVLADSGPWQSTKIGLGVVGGARTTIRAIPGSPESPSSVIILQKNSSDTATGPGPVENFNQLLGGSLPGNGQPYMLFYSAAGPLSNSVYGFHLGGAPSGSGARSNQVVQKPILDSSGMLLGYVELSEGPASGSDIVNSVASGLAVAGGLAILLAIAVGWWTSRRFTAPLLSLTQATQRMSSGDLSVRVAEAERTDEFGTLGKSFNQMAGRIEETIQTLRRFLADAAHELQTPLTALRTNLELANSEVNNAATENYLVHVLEQIERLQRMIKDLLSLSRLESATGPEAFEQVNLNDLVRQVSEPYAARAEQAGQAFELDLPAHNLQVMGSPEKLTSALGNLLDNALKFTPAGGTVTIHLSETPENVCLNVADTGIGIPPEEIEMLFNRFHRGRNASSYPGSGLGLAIVRAIAQAHSGSVQAVNNLQGGASFTLCLPKS
jgi:signal transduction histidine kinase